MITNTHVDALPYSASASPARAVFQYDTVSLSQIFVTLRSHIWCAYVADTAPSLLHWYRGPLVPRGRQIMQHGPLNSADISGMHFAIVLTCVDAFFYGTCDAAESCTGAEAEERLGMQVILTAAAAAISL